MKVFFQRNWSSSARKIGFHVRTPDISPFCIKVLLMILISEAKKS